MSVNILKCSNLSKTYGHFKALDGINLTLQGGHIYGLVGNNGAGKTTLMRLIMGLTFPTKGQIELFGESSPRKLIANRKRIGALIENPIYTGTISGKKNLELLCNLYGIKDPKAVDDVLEQLNLTHKADTAVRHYSLGMKQRLGLAGALLGQPDFLILDEPTNGLDPSGIREIRETLLSLHQQRGIPMLISSHYLSELNLLATDYIILHQGKVIHQFTQEELTQHCKSYIVLELESIEKIEAAINTLKQAYPNIDLTVMPNHEIHIYDFIHSLHSIPGPLALAGIEIKKLDTVGTTFEEYFAMLIGGEKNA